MVGKTSSISPRSWAASAAAGVNQPWSTHLVAVDRRLLAVGQRRQEEVGVEADHDLGGRDPARELHERAGVGDDDAGLLLQLAHGRDAVGRVALALVGVDRAAGEDPHAAHEARRAACA